MRVNCEEEIFSFLDHMRINSTQCHPLLRWVSKANVLQQVWICCLVRVMPHCGVSEHGNRLPLGHDSLAEIMDLSFFKEWMQLRLTFVMSFSR